MLYRHAIRAALTPVVSQLGVDIGTLAGGAVVTETVFGLGGIGQQSVTSIFNGDTPVVLGIVLVAALFVVVANIVVDALYSILYLRVQLARYLRFAARPAGADQLDRPAAAGQRGPAPQAPASRSRSSGRPAGRYASSNT